MDLHVYNTLILSDLHLGAETSRAREATRVLKEKPLRAADSAGRHFCRPQFCPPDQGALEVSWVYPKAFQSQAQH
jgi:hypothetical protein